MQLKHYFKVVFLLILGLNVFAQQGINYKAIIKDANGNVINNESVDIQFTILQDANAVYEESHTTNSDANGIVVLYVGEGSVISGDFSTINWSLGNYFLNVQIDIGNGYADLGTTQFKAVPFAIKATNMAIDNLIDAKVYNSSQDKSIYLGFNAGLNDITDTGVVGVDGQHNIGIGANALLSNIAGNGNLALGFRSLENNDSGNNNISFGNSALQLNTEGDDNIAIGNGTLTFNTSGKDNIGIGSLVLRGNSSNNRNIAIGRSSLSNNLLGDNNVAIGYAAGLLSNSSGNIFLGYEAGYNEVGSDKLYIENSRANSSEALIYGDFSSDFIRFNALGEFRDGIRVDNTTFFVNEVTNNVGVRTLSPDYPLSISGQLNLNEDIGGDNVALRVNGDEALWYNGTYFSWGFGASHNYFSRNIGINDTTPNARLHINASDDVALNTTNNGLLLLGSNFAKNIAIDNNEIMARDNGSASELRLQENGGNVLVGGAIVQTSDQRLKKDIEDLEYGLPEILQLLPKAYNWKNRDDKDYKSLGLLAQEVQPILPNIVGKNDDSNMLHVNYVELIPILINAIKDQQKHIEKQNNDYKTLLERVQLLEASSKK